MPDVHEFPAHAGFLDAVAVQNALYRTTIVPVTQPGDEAFPHRALPPPVVLHTRIALQFHLLAIPRAHPGPANTHLLTAKIHITGLLTPAQAPRCGLPMMPWPHPPGDFIFDHRLDRKSTRLNSSHRCISY